MRIIAVCAIALFETLLFPALAHASPPPAWAYPVAPPGHGQEQDENTSKRVPNSSVVLTWGEISTYGHPAPDWHPDEHPKMPEIVSRGREGAVWACAYCHLPNGAGRPANASLAGRTPRYMEQQVRLFANDQRTGSEPKRVAQALMVEVAKAVTDAELKEALDYFAALKAESFQEIIESPTAPKTYVTGEMVAVVEGAPLEPLGNRIIEVPVDFEQSENRDSRTKYKIYVPVGSLSRGAELVKTGKEGKTISCFACHGQTLQGLADVPGIAGRSPSYLMRQLVDVQRGTRGTPSDLMKAVVAKLTEAEMIDIVAYLATLPP